LLLAATLAALLLAAAVTDCQAAAPLIRGFYPAYPTTLDIVSIFGSGFGTQKGVVVVEVVENNGDWWVVQQTYRLGPASPRIKLWRDQRIDIKLPVIDWPTGSLHDLRICVKAGPPESRVASNKKMTRVIIATEWDPHRRLIPPDGPFIMLVAPNETAGGGVIHIYGIRFGAERGSVVLEEWIDEDFTGYTPAEEVHGPQSTSIRRWTNGWISLELGALMGWREWNGSKGAEVYLEMGPPEAPVVSNKAHISIR
jgi:hypothetical protein